MRASPDTELLLTSAGIRGAGLWRELLASRELLGFLVWRDVAVRYRQTVLGLLWVLIRPLLAMGVFFVVFHRVAGFSSGSAPYPLFAFAGTMVWMLFSDGVNGAVQNMTGGAPLLTKVYFPRVLIPMAAVLRGGVDFAVSMVLFVLLCAGFGMAVPWTWVLLPAIAVWAILLALGVGLWTSAFAVRFRDVAHGLGFLLQLLFWISPVGFGLSALPERLHLLVALNPLAGLLEAARSCLLGGSAPPVGILLLSLVLTGLLLVTGWMVFHRMERDFADVV